MRIAVMLRALDERGGVAVYARNLLHHLLELNQEDEYLLLYRSSSHLGLHGVRQGVTERVLRGRSKAVWDQISVPAAAYQFRADVILHPKFTVPLAGSIPSVMVLHGADWFLPDAARFYGRLDRLYMRLFMPLYLRKSRIAVSVSQLTTDDFNGIFELPPGKVRTVYFGPASHFRKIDDPHELARVRHKYGLPERYILTLARVDDGGRKNVAGLFAAYPSIHARTSCPLVIGGAELERWRSDFRLPDRGWGEDVYFPGYLDQADLPAIYSGAQLYLYPSNQEAFPIPLTEAMACGTPIVTSRVNGLAEIAGNAAALVDPHDPHEIADVTIRMLGDPGERARRSETGYQRSRDFSWPACARAVHAILKEAAGQEGGK